MQQEEKRTDAYRSSPWTLLGQATVDLKPFKHVTGVDASENMICPAREMLENGRDVDDDNDRPRPVIDFVQGSAEKSDFLEDDSIDLVIAGTFGFLPSLFIVPRLTSVFFIYIRTVI